jgi:hypothetical protein
VEAIAVFFTQGRSTLEVCENDKYSVALQWQLAYEAVQKLIRQHLTCIVQAIKNISK